VDFKVVIVSVNILTWNNAPTVGLALDNIESDLHGVEHEYIFVDNGSDDGTCDKIRDWCMSNLDSNFVYVFNPENRGISVGKNQGIDRSRGKYIFMCDGDVVPVLNSIKLLIEKMDNSDIDALGMFPNKFATSPDMAEPFCDNLTEPRKFKCCCLYYGMFRRSIFDNGLRMNEEGEFGKPGYGWEDHDFFMRMKKAGVDQYITGINKETGKYYHAINSSIRAMGRNEYIRTSKLRDKQFKEIWEYASGQGITESLGPTGRVGGTDRKRDRDAGSWP
jgi:glycosyltransferase involved in cell wall biosynthesis